MRLAAYEVTIAAPIEVVWAHLTTAEGRLVFTYGWEDGRLGVPPESTTVEIDLAEAEDGATSLRLVHHGLPPETVPDHQRGWTYFLGVLRDTVSATGDAAPGGRRDGRRQADGRARDQDP